MKTRHDPQALSLSAPADTGEVPRATAGPAVAKSPAAKRAEPSIGATSPAVAGSIATLRAPSKDIAFERRTGRRKAAGNLQQNHRADPPPLNKAPPQGSEPPDRRTRLLVQSRPRDNLAVPTTVSVLLHALVVLAFILHITPRPQEPTPPATVALVWQPNPSRKLSLPNPGTFKNAPPAEARRGGRGRISPAARPPSPEQPPAEASQTPEQATTEASKAPEQKTANAEQAEATKKTTPSPKHPTQTREARRTTPAPPSVAQAFSNLTNLSLQGPPAPSTPGENSAEMPGPAPPGHASLGNSVDSLDAPNASPDWEAEMRAWVEARDYYPEEAVAKHEEGISTVEITIDKTGKVTDLELVGMSGSDRLDDAWLSVFRNRTVPAPTPDMDADNGYTFRATLQYVLIERMAQ